MSNCEMALLLYRFSILEQRKFFRNMSLCVQQPREYRCCLAFRLGSVCHKLQFRSKFMEISKQTHFWKAQSIRNLKINVSICTDTYLYSCQYNFMALPSLLFLTLVLPFVFTKKIALKCKSYVFLYNSQSLVTVLNKCFKTENRMFGFARHDGYTEY